MWHYAEVGKKLKSTVSIIEIFQDWRLPFFQSCINYTYLKCKLYTVYISGSARPLIIFVCMSWRYRYFGREVEALASNKKKGRKPYFLAVVWIWSSPPSLHLTQLYKLASFPLSSSFFSRGRVYYLPRLSRQGDAQSIELPRRTPELVQHFPL